MLKHHNIEEETQLEEQQKGSNATEKQLSLERILGFKAFLQTLKKHIQTIKPMLKILQNGSFMCLKSMNFL